MPSVKSPPAILTPAAQKKTKEARKTTEAEAISKIVRGSPDRRR
jgi:hypothetical protein